MKAKLHKLGKTCEGRTIMRARNKGEVCTMKHIRSFWGLLVLMLVFSVASAVAGTWQNSGGSWWYDNGDGSYPASQWKEIDGKWYYFDEEGYMVTGWKQLGGVWYLFLHDGTMATGWVQDGGSWYYLNKDGLVTTGWAEIDGKYYCFDSNGRMQTGWMQGRYYLKDNGVMASKEWIQLNGDWFFFTEEGSMAAGWVEIDGDYFFFDSEGRMQTGWLHGSSWYYLKSSGVMAADEWVQINGKWFYFKSDGAMAVGWTKDQNTWYYMDENGQYVTGWLNQGSWYYFDSTGAMATGLQLIDNQYYLFDDDGKMQDPATDSVTSLSGVISRLNAAYRSGSMETAFYISLNLIAQNGTELEKVLESNGVFFEPGNGVEWSYFSSSYDKAPIITIRKTGSTSSIWFPGYEIMRAVNQGTTGSLPGRYQRALAAAREIVSGISGSSLEKAYAIKDKLARRITYKVVDDSWEDDCALGALLNGVANCDGYSDAFYLCASLAGIDTRLVAGWSRKSNDAEPRVYFRQIMEVRPIRSLPSDSDQGHAWNMIRINGTWRALDVTWDDTGLNESDLDMDLFSNQGLDDMSSNYTWYSSTMPGTILGSTNLSEKRLLSIAVSTEDQLQKAFRTARSRGSKDIAVYLSPGIRPSNSYILPSAELMLLEGGRVGKEYIYYSRGILVERSIQWVDLVQGSASTLNQLTALVKEAVNNKSDGVVARITADLKKTFDASMGEVLDSAVDAGYKVFYSYFNTRNILHIILER